MADQDPGQDSLFREINEELRHDQFAKLWKKYGNYAISVAVIAIVGVAAYQAWQSYDLDRKATDSAQFAAALRLANSDRAADATGTLTKLAETGTAGYAQLSKLDRAGLMARAGEKKEASAAYLAIANDQETVPELRNLALLLSVLHDIDNGDPKALSERIAPLTATNDPWRHTAKEFTALLAQRMGESQRAGQLYRELADDATAPSGVRARAAEMTAILGG